MWFAASCWGAQRMTNDVRSLRHLSSELAPGCGRREQRDSEVLLTDITYAPHVCDLEIHIWHKSINAFAHIQLFPKQDWY